MEAFKTRSNRLFGIELDNLTKARISISGFTKKDLGSDNPVVKELNEYVSHVVSRFDEDRVRVDQHYDGEGDRAVSLIGSDRIVVKNAAVLIASFADRHPNLQLISPAE